MDYGNPMNELDMLEFRLQIDIPLERVQIVWDYIVQQLQTMTGIVGGPY